eukprot:767825-Hanusia_phi.AAC.1
MSPGVSLVSIALRLQMYSYAPATASTVRVSPAYPPPTPPSPLAMREADPVSSLRLRFVSDLLYSARLVCFGLDFCPLPLPSSSSTCPCGDIRCEGAHLRWRSSCLTGFGPRPASCRGGGRLSRGGSHLWRKTNR